MTRRRYADVIHAWAEGAEIEFRRKYGQFNWAKTENPEWDAEGVEFRIKPKEPEWWENIPEHGILVRNPYKKENVFAVFPSMYISEYTELTPLTNEEIKEFIR